jgi:integrase
VARRREKGDGSIYQRGDGLYVAYARIPETGKRRYVYSKTRGEVAQKLKALQKQIDTRAVVTSKKETVEAYLHYWISVRAGRKDIKPSTIESYRQHLKPVFQRVGHVKLTKLTPDMLQTMCNSLLDQFKTSYVKAIMTILATALHDAIRWNRLSYNPCKGVILPQADKHEGPVLTGEQAQSLINAAKGRRLEALLTLALATGLRKGELLGLQWSDIDLDARLLKISRNAVYLPDKETGRHRMTENTPKSKAGKRAIKLPQFAVNALREHRARQLEQRLQAGANWKAHDLIFCNDTGGYYTPTTLRRRFNELLEAAGLPEMRIHDLRHSAATLLLKMGVPLKVVQEILGHSNFNTTANTYAHVLQESLDEAASKMGAVFLSSK